MGWEWEFGSAAFGVMQSKYYVYLRACNWNFCPLPSSALVKFSQSLLLNKCSIIQWAFFPCSVIEVNEPDHSTHHTSSRRLFNSSKYTLSCTKHRDTTRAPITSPFELQRDLLTFEHEQQFIPFIIILPSRS